VISSRASQKNVIAEIEYHNHIRLHMFR